MLQESNFIIQLVYRERNNLFCSNLQLDIHLSYDISDDNYIHQILRSLINIARLT